MKKTFIIFSLFIIFSNFLSGMDRSGLRRRNVTFARTQERSSTFARLHNDIVNTTGSTVITAGGSAIAYVGKEALRQMAQKETAIGDKQVTIALGVGMAIVGGMLCIANGARLASGCLQECQRTDSD